MECDTWRHPSSVNRWPARGSFNAASTGMIVAMACGSLNGCPMAWLRSSSAWTLTSISGPENVTGSSNAPSGDSRRSGVAGTGVASVDDQHLTGHHGGALRREPQRDVADVVGCRESSERRRRDDAVSLGGQLGCGAEGL